MTASRGSPITDLTLSSDQHFVRPLAVTLASLASAHTSSALTLHIINDGIGSRDRDRLEECAGRHAVRWIQPDIDRYEGVRTADKMPRASWFRISLGELLPDVERVLYLDADVIVERDLAELLDTHLGGNVIGAVREAFYGVFGVLGGPPYVELGVRAGSPYFNAGVLVMDLGRWRAEGAGEAVLEVLRAHHLPMGDQDALNTMFAGRWHELHPCWNVQTAHLVAGRSHHRTVANARRIARAIDEPGIVHFTGRIVKPWNDRSHHPYGDRWYEVLDRTPYAGWRPSPPSAATLPGLKRRAAGRYLAARRGYRRWSQTIVGPRVGRLTGSVDSVASRRRRVMQQIADATSGRVASGPFAGLRLRERNDDGDTTLSSSQFLGVHHLELHEWLESLIEAGPPLLVVYGANDSVVPVGLAQRLPCSMVRVLTDDALNARACVHLARLNGVDQRVMVTGTEHLSGIECADVGAPWLVDGSSDVTRLIETLKRCAAASEVVIEAHDRTYPSFTPSIISELADSHRAILVPRSGRDPYSIPVLEEFDEIDRWIAVSDNPGNLDYWIRLSPIRPIGS